MVISWVGLIPFTIWHVATRGERKIAHFGQVIVTQVFLLKSLKTVRSCECRSMAEDSHESLIDCRKDINCEIMGLKSTVDNEPNKVKPLELCESHILVKGKFMCISLSIDWPGSLGIKMHNPYTWCSVVFIYK